MRRIWDQVDRGGEIEPSCHDVEIKTEEIGVDKVTHLFIDGRSVGDWMKDGRG